MGVSFFFSHSIFDHKKKHKWPKKSTHFSLTFFHLNLNGLFLFFFSPIPYSTTKKKHKWPKKSTDFASIHYCNECFFFVFPQFEWVFPFFFFQFWMSVSFFFPSPNSLLQTQVRTKRILCWRSKSTKKKNCSPITCHDNNSKKSILVTLAFLLRQVWFACPIDCVEKKETIHWVNASEVVGEFNQIKRKQHCCPQLKKKTLANQF